MTIQELVDELVGRGTGLDGTLDKAGELVPDMKGETDEARSVLAQAVDPANLAAFVLKWPKEALEAFKGHLSPRDNPGNFA